MKKMILKFWDAWCEKVEKHNEPLRNYVTMEECWEPIMIFDPLIYGAIAAFVWALFSVLAAKYEALVYAGLFGLITALITAFFMILHWKIHSKKQI